MQFLTGNLDLTRWRVPALLIAAASLFLSACSALDDQSFGFWDLFWSMITFFFLFMLIWIFIGVFADIFRRNDLSGGMKALWILAIFILPLIGILIYMVTRPKVTAQDLEMMTQADAAQQAAAQVTPVDQIAKLDQLKASGAITQPEYDELKRKAMAGG